MKYTFKVPGERIRVAYTYELRKASYLRIISFFIVRFRFTYMNK